MKPPCFKAGRLDPSGTRVRRRGAAKTLSSAEGKNEAWMLPATGSEAVSLM